MGSARKKCGTVGSADRFCCYKRFTYNDDVSMHWSETSLRYDMTL